jgi:PEP-CTERM motif
MRHMSFRGIIGAIVLGVIPALVPLPCRAGLIVETEFGKNLDDWTSNTPNEVNWVMSGGNPGGYASFVDASGTGTYIAAPAKFLFDYEAAGLDGSGAISFDHKIFASGPGDTYAPYMITLSGPNGAATWTGDVPAVSNFMTPWVTVTALLNQSDWKVTSGSWVGLLDQVTSLQIQMELVVNPGGAGFDTEGIDNVILASVPEPGTMTMAATGLACVGLLFRRCRRTNRPGRAA